jgi:hypothetical protein
VTACQRYVKTAFGEPTDGMLTLQPIGIYMAAGLMLLLFDRIEQMTRDRIVGFTCETHDWDY